MGPIFEFDVNNRLTLIAGYYFTREHNQSRWATINRPFGGGETMLWSRAVEVDWRSLLERFAIAHEPDYSRFRNRLRISRPGQTAPYAGVELFIDAKGLRSVRYSVRLRRALGKDFIVEFG